MFSHIMVGANDIEESRLFYDKVLGVLGSAPGILTVNPTGHKRYMYAVGDIMFLISEPIDDSPASTPIYEKKSKAIVNRSRIYGRQVWIPRIHSHVH